jgi:hypothetical protein
VRASFHVAWLLLVAALAALGARPRWRAVLRLAAAPLLVAALWYGKNLVLFGSFSSSTWLGMNLARVALDSLPPARRSDLVKQGVLSPLAKVAPFRELAAYARHVERPRPTRVPALDLPSKPRRTPNFNHAAYVGISRRFLKDSTAAIAASPDAYLRGIERAVRIYVRAPSDYWLLDSNSRRITAYVRLYERVVYGVQPTRWCAVLVAALPLSLAYALHAGIARRRRIGRASSTTLLFLAGNIAYLTLVSTVLDAGENNRFRFPLDALVMVLVLLALRGAALRVLRALA